MKCHHCATEVERSDWFCPHCRRALRRPPSRRFWWGLGGGVAAVSLAVGSLVYLRSQAPLPIEAPEVIISELPGLEVEIAEAQRPQPEKPSTQIEEEERGDRRGSETDPAPPAPAAPRPRGTGTLTVTTLPDSSRTFVYLNGGKLLGETPLLNAPVPAGKHTLVFWTPSLGGRSVRRVEVEPGGSVVVVEQVRKQESFAEAAGI